MICSVAAFGCLTACGSGQAASTVTVTGPTETVTTTVTQAAPKPKTMPPASLARLVRRSYNRQDRKLGYSSSTLATRVACVNTARNLFRCEAILQSGAGVNIEAAAGTNASFIWHATN
jgi:hypothetical protein